MEGTISRTATVSVARRNLKKAEGKIPARRTEIAYKAATTRQAGTCLIKLNIHPEGVEVDAAGVWEEGHANYPGRSVVPHWAKSGAGELKSSFLMFGSGGIRSLPLKVEITEMDSQRDQWTRSR
jgi:hypothetical protein